MTPRSENPNELEGGFLLEHYLWGTCNIKYWNIKHCKQILEKDRWIKGGTIYSEEELSNFIEREIDNPKCSGLCAEFRRKAEL